MTRREVDDDRSLPDSAPAPDATRVWIFLAGLIGWAALALATAALASLPIATFLPLLVLAGVFEAMLAVNTGAAGTRDPLFATIFLLATLVNFVPVLLAEPVAIELSVVGSVHAAFLARVLVAKRKQKVGSRKSEV